MKREEIIQYAGEKFGSEPEYLWAKHPAYCILRHESNKKWYAVIMDVPGEKLGLPCHDAMTVLNVKCGSALLGSLLETKGYLPAYHMNKASWVTVLLDGSVPREEILNLLTVSYDLTKVRRKAKA
ncbi:MAG: MmcQ/YjbR family DNA-binding protein [Oscillospiraceae bacterium]|nr:MmcQ/YjbR family DNA-binding protein [Oscillospiraceae bacterium]